MITEKRVSNDPDPDAVAALELMILERAVIEASVKWRTVYDADSRYALDRAIDALLKAREK